MAIALNAMVPIVLRGLPLIVTYYRQPKWNIGIVGTINLENTLRLSPVPILKTMKVYISR